MTLVSVVAVCNGAFTILDLSESVLLPLDGA